MQIETPRLTISLLEPPDIRIKPREIQEIFNSNLDYIRDSEGLSAPREYSLSEIEVWPLFRGPTREHQRFLGLRLRNDLRLVGFGDLLAPHPRRFLAALGLLIIRGDMQSRGLGREAALAIENALANEGWPEIELAVLPNRPRSRRFWESCGYRYAQDSVNEAGQPCWVLRKKIDAQVV